MAQLLKPTPERYCQFCGKKLERKRLPNGDLEYLIHFNRKVYCDRNCMKQAFAQKPSCATSWSGTHKAARKIVPKGSCEICGAANALDVHHLDCDYQNNDPQNLIRICRSCHIKQHRFTRSCSVCGKPVKGLGYCDKHYQRFKKWGNPLMVKQNQHRPAMLCAD